MNGMAAGLSSQRREPTVVRRWQRAQDAGTRHRLPSVASVCQVSTAVPTAGGGYIPSQGGVYIHVQVRVCVCVCVCACVCVCVCVLGSIGTPTSSTVVRSPSWMFPCMPGRRVQCCLSSTCATNHPWRWQEPPYLLRALHCKAVRSALCRNCSERTGGARRVVQK